MVSTIEVTLDHALFYARHLNMCDPKYVATAVLLELGISTHRDGFEYLVRAIALYSRNPLQLYAKQLYIEVGEDAGTDDSAKQVEQAIRSVIIEAWKLRDDEVWRCYFPADKNGSIPKPSNGYFISRIGRFLQLWEGCCEGVCYEKG